VPAVVNLAKQQITLFQDDGSRGDDEAPVTPDIIKTLSRFQEGGVGVGQLEAFRLSLSIKKLATKFPIEQVRFWGLLLCCYHGVCSLMCLVSGKIFGLEKDYLIVEAKYKDGEAPKPAEEEPAPEPPAEDNGDETADVLPKSQYKPPPVTPTEEHGSGTNKKIYFVCNEGA
jgi:radial spoke head protein 4A